MPAVQDCLICLRKFWKKYRIPIVVISIGIILYLIVPILEAANIVSENTAQSLSFSAAALSLVFIIFGACFWVLIYCFNLEFRPKYPFMFFDRDRPVQPRRNRIQPSISERVSAQREEPLAENRLERADVAEFQLDSGCSASSLLIPVEPSSSSVEQIGEGSTSGFSGQRHEDMKKTEMLTEDTEKRHRTRRSLQGRDLKEESTGSSKKSPARVLEGSRGSVTTPVRRSKRIGTKTME